MVGCCCREKEWHTPSGEVTGGSRIFFRGCYSCYLSLLWCQHMSHSLRACMYIRCSSQLQAGFNVKWSVLGKLVLLLEVLCCKQVLPCRTTVFLTQASQGVYQFSLDSAFCWRPCLQLVWTTYTHLSVNCCASAFFFNLFLNTLPQHVRDFSHLFFSQVTTYSKWLTCCQDGMVDGHYKVYTVMIVLGPWPMLLIHHLWSGSGQHDAPLRKTQRGLRNLSYQEPSLTEACQTTMLTVNLKHVIIANWTNSNTWQHLLCQQRWKILRTSHKLRINAN